MSAHTPGPIRRYTIQYQAGSYSGERTVFAEDSDQAISKVRKYVRKTMTSPMYYEHYAVKGDQ